MAENQKGTISFQGEIGANSHIVCNQNYPNMDVLPCETFREALMAVEEDRADLAMIAIENSLAGRVADIHHLLPHSKLFMIAEYFLPIRFHLMGVKGSDLSDIKKVYSHVVGLPQCKNFILKHNLKTEVAPDTAGSARMVSEWNDKSLGAIAPEIAAEIYGLDIIARDIEDEAHNTTRFVVFSKDKIEFKKNGEEMITSFLFRVRNVPASLYKALGGFATNGVNMTKLESYQVDGGFSATQFYAEVIGHPDDRSLQLAFEELAFFTDDIKIFGTYKRNSDRDKFVKR